MNVLVLGASGMAGHVVALYLRENGFTVDTLAAHKALDKDTHLIDVTDLVKFRGFLATNKYDAVINCIGLLVKQSEARKDLAVYLNSYLPHLLEDYFKHKATKVIHISTDDVFSYKSPPYHENTSYDGETFYGRTKALGEIINDKDLTFRASIIGPDMREDGSGLFNWFYKQTGEISGYTNVLWNGITTVELAKVMEAALKQNVSGVFHPTPHKNISKFDLLRLFKGTFNRTGLEIKPTEGLAANKTLLSTRNDFEYHVPDYKTMIHDMKAWINNHPNLYQHYEKG